MEVPGVEPTWRQTKKPKYCADLHNVDASLRDFRTGRLGALGSVRKPVNPGRLGDRWATDFQGEPLQNKGYVERLPGVASGFDRNSPGNPSGRPYGDEGELSLARAVAPRSQTGGVRRRRPAHLSLVSTGEAEKPA